MAAPDHAPGALYLGVDTGATKSVAMLADGTGRVRGYARGGPGNWETVGWDGTRALLQAIIRQVTRAASASIEQITAAGFGLAGYDWPEDRPPHLALLRDLGLAGPLVLVNDAFLGLAAGAEQGWGVVVSAGTSCNCYGRDRAGRIGRVVGSSSFGEYAGAEELVQWGLRAVARAWTRRGEPTALSAAFAAAAGAEDVPDLLAGLMRGRYRLDARHARLLFSAAAQGDEVAAAGVTWAGRQLADLALGVIRQLDLQRERFPLVLSGSFFNGSERLESLVARVVQGEAPGAAVCRLQAPPVAGAVLLAMERSGPVAPPVRRTLLQSAQSQHAG